MRKARNSHDQRHPLSTGARISSSSLPAWNVSIRASRTFSGPLSSGVNQETTRQHDSGCSESATRTRNSATVWCRVGTHVHVQSHARAPARTQTNSHTGAHACACTSSHVRGFPSSRQRDRLSGWADPVIGATCTDGPMQMSVLDTPSHAPSARGRARACRRPGADALRSPQAPAGGGHVVHRPYKKLCTLRPKNGELDRAARRTYILLSRDGANSRIIVLPASFVEHPPVSREVRVHQPRRPHCESSGVQPLPHTMLWLPALHNTSYELPVWHCNPLTIRDGICPDGILLIKNRHILHYTVLTLTAWHEPVH